MKRPAIVVNPAFFKLSQQTETTASPPSTPTVAAATPPSMPPPRRAPTPPPPSTRHNRPARPTTTPPQTTATAPKRHVGPPALAMPKSSDSSDEERTVLPASGLSTQAQHGRLRQMASPEVVLTSIVVGLLAATLPVLAHHESRLWVSVYIVAVCATMMTLYRMLADWARLSLGGGLAMLGAWAVWAVHGVVFRRIESGGDDVTVGVTQAVLFFIVVAMTFVPTMHPYTWHLFAYNTVVALAFPHRDAVSGECNWLLVLSKVYGFAVLYLLSDVVCATLVDRWHYARAAKDRDATPPPERAATRTGRAIVQSLWVLFAFRYALALLVVQVAVLVALTVRNRSTVAKAAWVLWPRVWNDASTAGLPTHTHSSPIRTTLSKFGRGSRLSRRR